MVDRHRLACGLARRHGNRRLPRSRAEGRGLGHDRSIGLRQVAGPIGLPHGHHGVAVGPDAAVLVAVAHLVAVAERYALGGQERTEEWRDPEHLVADLLEELAD